MQQINFQPAKLLKRTAQPVNIPFEQRVAYRTGTSQVVDARSNLILEVLRSFDQANITYCHWKSNWRIDEWLTGTGDLDLLLAKEDVESFTEILLGLGFKKAIVQKSDDVPGIENFYGYDDEIGKFIHVHAHYQLVLGHDASKNYLLPRERAVLDTRFKHGPIYIVEPETELAIFIVRMTLKYSPFEELLRVLHGSLDNHRSGLRTEYRQLRAKIDEDRFAARVKELLPEVPLDLIRECGRAIGDGRPATKRVRLRRSLEIHIRAYARIGYFTERSKRLKRFSATFVRKLAAGRPPTKQFEKGGKLIAIIGGDGSGKSTCSADVNKWLGKKFDVSRYHLGIPPKSAVTLAAIAAIRVRRYLRNLRWLIKRNPVSAFDPFEPYVDLLQRFRWLCTARDRHRLHRRLRRKTANGKIVLCDRYPTASIHLMDAPRIERSINGRPAGKVEKFLINREHYYYSQIQPPDRLIVLRVNPKKAVRRKKNEPARHVRDRTAELWGVNWDGTGAHVVDANQKRGEVIDKVRSLVWDAL